MGPSCRLGLPVMDQLRHRPSMRRQRHRPTAEDGEKHWPRAGWRGDFCGAHWRLWLATSAVGVIA